MTTTKTVEEITPKRAHRLLAAARPGTRAGVHTQLVFADQMRDTRHWEPGYATITLDKDGRLVGGQHLLQAVQLVGRPVALTVERQGGEPR